MVVAVIIAVIAAGVLALEWVSRTDPHSAFIFALLDLLVDDEPPVESPRDPLPDAERETYSQRAA